MKIAYDKKLHFIAGFIVTMIANVIFYDVYLSLSCGIMIGLIKEIIDEVRYGGFDIMDMVYTVFGSVIAALVYTIYLFKSSLFGL